MDDPLYSSSIITSIIAAKTHVYFFNIHLSSWTFFLFNFFWIKRKKMLALNFELLMKLFLITNAVIKKKYINQEDLYKARDAWNIHRGRNGLRNHCWLGWSYQINGIELTQVEQRQSKMNNSFMWNVNIFNILSWEIGTKYRTFWYFLLLATCSWRKYRKTQKQNITVLIRNFCKTFSVAFQKCLERYYSGWLRKTKNICAVN